MRWLSLFVASLLSVTLPIFAVADHGHSAKRHNALAQRARANATLERRQSFDNGQLTWYDVGLGACGNWNNPPDMIIAISHTFFNGQYPDPHCGKSVTVSNGNKQIQVIVQDECMGCDANHIDGSKGVFESLAPGGDLGVGEMQVSWWFDDGAPATSPKPTPTPTSTKEAPPPPSSTTHKTSSSPPPPPPPSSTSSSTSSSSTHSSSSSSSHPPSSSHSSSSSSSVSSTHSSTSSTATPTPTGPNVLAAGSQAFLGMAALVAAGGNAV